MLYFWQKRTERSTNETSKSGVYLPDPSLYAVKQVQDEMEQYKKNLERNRTQYKIVEQTEQPDGSIMIKLIQQYNAAMVGNYLE